MDTRIRIAVLTSLALSWSVALQAQPPGYYYPQPVYYGPYAPYTHQIPAYPLAAPAAPVAETATAASETTESAATSTQMDADHAASGGGRYPLIEPQALDTAADHFKIEQSRLGAVLAGHDGRTLYVAMHDDGDNQLPCTESCARHWHAYLLDGEDAAPTPFAEIRREDGSRQWSDGQRPLYQWIGDEDAGDVTGDGVDGLWFAVRIR